LIENQTKVEALKASLGPDKQRKLLPYYTNMLTTYSKTLDIIFRNTLTLTTGKTIPVYQKFTTKHLKHLSLYLLIFGD